VPFLVPGMNFSQLPPRLRAYILVSAALAALTSGLTMRGHQVQDWGLFVGLLGLAGLAGALKVELPVQWGRMSLGAAVTFFALLRLGIPEAIAVNAISALASACFRRIDGKARFNVAGVPLYRIIFNLSNHALCAAAAGGAFRLVGGVSGAQHSQIDVVAIGCSATAYYLVNTFGTAAAIAWSQSLRVSRVWRENFLWTAPAYLAAACGAAALSWLYATWKPIVVLMTPLFYIIYHSFRLQTDKHRQHTAHMAELNALNQSVITSLAMAIDAKDRYTHKHINRVREYAVGLAERLGLSPEEIEAVKIAALLHDIGKLAVPENILGKPGKLTPEEFEVIKTHVTVGAMILEPVRFPWPVVPIVMSHHERWDGNGYPKGLQGEEIPIGGRIVSLADVFDALTSTRPYRSAMTREKAIEFLQAGSGTQFDPHVVDTFVASLPEIEARIEQLELLDGEEDSEAEGVAATARERASDALEQIAKANEAMFALCELTDLISARPDSEEILDLVVQKVEKLVPASTTVIFLVDQEEGELKPACVRGLLPELFDDMTIKIGEGASGWVVEQNEPLLNGAASLDVARKLKPTDNLELTSTLCVPLLVESRVIGTITLYHTSYEYFKPHHQRLLSLIAEHAAPAMETARTFTLTRQLAMEDTLTSLPNARALMQFLRHELAESERQEGEFGVLLMDVDNFKLVNDSMGHLEGDRILQRIGHILQESVRDMDFVARYAGDEFVVVLPHASAAVAEVVTQRIRRAVAQFAWEWGQVELGISIGQAFYPVDGTDAKRLLGVADGRMYIDKSARKKQREQPAPSLSETHSDPPVAVSSST
jgi:diguanylate cyclase (GGDEF)-like protein/putative nucleotidyltransferase with HDIG domain